MSTSKTDFPAFKKAVANRFADMAGRELFRVNLNKDALWDLYLASFPEGSNPVYEKRTEHDCSCCRHFIRSVGDAVAIIDGEVVSAWDITCTDPTYQIVANALAAFVKQHAVADAFLHTERTAGTDKNFEQLLDKVVTWDHFFVNIPTKYVCKGEEIGPRLSTVRARHDVLYRSLTELTDDAVDTVLELISQNSLYRGVENRASVSAFRNLKQEFNKLKTDTDKHAFVWSKISEVSPAVSMIRNSAIGTLLVNLSDGMGMDEAVRKFEVVVAPANYKRPTALVTKAMIEKAKAALEELELIPSLERRYATLEDININDILFADRSARTAITGDVFDELVTKARNKPKNLDKVEEISIDKFISDIIPRAQSLEVFVENRHSGNLVSLVAPANATAKGLFKWDNPYSWSYNGDVADSIKERVKKAGGNVTGEVLCRLAWHNYDDLDLHMYEPSGHIYFGDRRSRSSGGELDVDMNAGGGRVSRDPVENIYYTNRRTMREGEYRLVVHNFCKREDKDVGFEVEFDYLGTIYHYVYDKPVRDRTTVDVVKFNYSHAKGIEIIESLPSTQTSKTFWNLKTQEFQPVSVVTLSPNYWGERQVGNKHYFFMLQNCRNEGQARGFYNEFLHESLTPHRKVIEMVGAKMKTEESAHQLSGLGFSSTQRNDVLVRVKGSFTRTVKVVF